MATANDPYLAPFIAGIHAGTGAVMISSARLPEPGPELDRDVVRADRDRLLRLKLGFDGMIVSDSLAGAAAIASVPVSQRGVRFIEAGGDLVLTTQAKNAPAMVAGLLTAAKASQAFTKAAHRGRTVRARRQIHRRPAGMFATAAVTRAIRLGRMVS